MCFTEHDYLREVPMDGTALKTARVLKIYSRLVNGDVLRKKNLRNNFMSRNGVFSVTWNRCAVFLQIKACGRILKLLTEVERPVGRPSRISESKRFSCWTTV